DDRMWRTIETCGKHRKEASEDVESGGGRRAELMQTDRAICQFRRPVNLRDVDTDAEVRAVVGAFDENASDLAALDENVVRPLDANGMIGKDSKCSGDGDGRGQCGVFCNGARQATGQGNAVPGGIDPRAAEAPAAAHLPEGGENC